MSLEFKTLYINQQNVICKKYNADIVIPDFEQIIGISDSFFSSATPINGLRHPIEKDTCGWYLWSGENFSEKEDFFKPYCVKHLIDTKPEIIKYLGLPPGFRFLVDEKGYEDVWLDNNLLYL